MSETKTELKKLVEKQRMYLGDAIAETNKLFSNYLETVKQNVDLRTYVIRKPNGHVDKIDAHEYNVNDNGILSIFLKNKETARLTAVATFAAGEWMSVVTEDWQPY